MKLSMVSLGYPNQPYSVLFIYLFIFLYISIYIYIYFFLHMHNYFYMYKFLNIYLMKKQFWTIDLTHAAGSCDGLACSRQCAAAIPSDVIGTNHACRWLNRAVVEASQVATWWSMPLGCVWSTPQKHDWPSCSQFKVVIWGGRIPL